MKLEAFVEFYTVATLLLGGEKLRRDQQQRVGLVGVNPVTRFSERRE